MDAHSASNDSHKAPLARSIAAARTACFMSALIWSVAAGAETTAPAVPPPNFSGFWIMNGNIGGTGPKFAPHDLPEGWRMFGTPDRPAPSLQKPAYEALKAQRLKEEKAVNIWDGLDAQTARCEAGGFPDFLSFDNPLDIMQRPDELLMVTERERQLPRHIYISPPHPLNPMYSPAQNGVFTHNGHSIGHWEDGTLVIKTDGFDPEPWMFSIERLGHSELMTTVERLSLSTDGSTLTDHLVITDPKTLTKPWKLTYSWHRASPDTEAVESTCEIDNNYLGIKGK